MLIKFATCLSSLFVFCRNNLHLLFFSFLLSLFINSMASFLLWKHFSHNFHFFFFSAYILSAPSNIIEAWKLCRQSISSGGLSVSDESGLFRWSEWQQELWALADSSSDLGKIVWGKLCDGSRRDSKESIHFTPNSSRRAFVGASEMRCSDKIFPNLNAFSVGTRRSMGVLLPIADCFSLAGRDLFTSPVEGGWLLIVVPA